MPKGDVERMKQIRDDLQALADKWKLVESHWQQWGRGSGWAVDHLLSW